MLTDAQYEKYIGIKAPTAAPLPFQRFFKRKGRDGQSVIYTCIEERKRMITEIVWKDDDDVDIRTAIYRSDIIFGSSISEGDFNKKLNEAFEVVRKNIRKKVNVQAQKLF